MLGHELIHVTERHTISAIQKNKSIQMGADEKLSGNAALLNQVVENVYLDIIEKGFGRAEENESDEKGVVAANKVGYAPQGLLRFLTRLQERNKDSKEKRGLFASHPELKERLERLTKQITAQKLTAAATLADRYVQAHFLQAGRADLDRARRGRQRRSDRGRREDERRRRRRTEEGRTEEGRTEEERVRPGPPRPHRRRRTEIDAGRGLGRYTRSGSREGRQRRPQPETRARQGHSRGHHCLQEGRARRLT